MLPDGDRPTGRPMVVTIVNIHQSNLIRIENLQWNARYFPASLCRFPKNAIRQGNLTPPSPGEAATLRRRALFDRTAPADKCIRLREVTAFVWHGFIVGIKPGQLYGYRIDGPWDPEHGHRFNYNKLLVDPYAQAIFGQVDWKQPIFPFDVFP